MRTFAQKPKMAQQIRPAMPAIPAPAFLGHRPSNDAFSLASARSENNFLEVSAQPAASSLICRKSSGGSSPMDGDQDEIGENAGDIARRVMRSPDLEGRQPCACGGTCPKCSNERQHAGHAHAQSNLPMGLGASFGVQEKPITSTPIRRLGHDFSQMRIFSGPRGADAIFRAATQGPGVSIPYQRDMEAAFGHRFTDVRAYLGRADEMKALGAAAATRGAHVVFRDTNPPVDTVAHELAHVVQQRGPAARAVSGSTRLSDPSEPAEQEAERVAAHVAEGRAVQVQQPMYQGIARQSTPPVPGESPRPSTEPAREIPPELMARVQAMLERSESELDDTNLSELGREAARMLGPRGVVAAAQQAGVQGAERRERELEHESGGGMIHRQAAEAAAATAGTMWWLTLVDGPLPVGDIIYGALIIAAALAASRAIRRCRCTIRYAPPDIMAQCPERVYGTGVTMHDCQNVAKFTAPQPCRQYYGHCGWMP